eukprot:1793537-Rhodomonas_salina.2
MRLECEIKRKPSGGQCPVCSRIMGACVGAASGCKLQYKKPHFQCKLYQECGFLSLISGSTPQYHARP